MVILTEEQQMNHIFIFIEENLCNIDLILLFLQVSLPIFLSPPIRPLIINKSLHLHSSNNLFPYWFLTISWLVLFTGMFNSSNIFTLFTSNNSGYSSIDAFSEIENEYLTLQRNYKYIVLNGYFNGRTANEPYF
jgi:hypothetical protein